MNKRWFRLLIFFPLIALLVFTNIYEDPANIFHDDSAAMAEAILKGKSVYFGSGNGDERAVKKNVIEGMPKHVECLTVGPSLSMGISRSDVGAEDYFNLSSSGLNYYDCLAIFGLLDLNDIDVDKIVYCVDSYFFNENVNVSGSHNPDMMPYAEYMLAILDGKTPEKPERDNLGQLKLKLSQAFSLTYFQSAITYIQVNNSYRLINKRWGIWDEYADAENSSRYSDDASLVYSIKRENGTEEEVINSSNDYLIEMQFYKGGHASDYSLATFDKLMAYLQKKGIEVEFFLCPLAPALWDRLQNSVDADQYYILDELEKLALDTASKYGFTVVGDYNPYKVGINNSDFIDSRHVKISRLSQYFDFKK